MEIKISQAICRSHSVEANIFLIYFKNLTPQNLTSIKKSQNSFENTFLSSLDICQIITNWNIIV